MEGKTNKKKRSSPKEGRRERLSPQEGGITVPRHSPPTPTGGGPTSPYEGLSSVLSADTLATLVTADGRSYMEKNREEEIIEHEAIEETELMDYERSSKRKADDISPQKTTHIDLTSDDDVPTVEQRNKIKGRKPAKQIRRIADTYDDETDGAASTTSGATHTYTDNEIDIGLEEAIRVFIVAELNNKDTPNIVNLGMSWLKCIDVIRIKSKRLQGKLSGEMKELIFRAMGVIRALAERVEDRGDAFYFKMQHRVLTDEIKSKDRELKNKIAENGVLEKEVTRLKDELQELQDANDDRGIHPVRAPVVTGATTVNKDSTEGKLDGIKKPRDIRPNSSAPPSKLVERMTKSRRIDADAISNLKKYFDRQLAALIVESGNTSQVETDMDMEWQPSQSDVPSDNSAARFDKPRSKKKPWIIRNVQMAPSSISKPKPTGSKTGDDYNNEEWTEVPRNRRTKIKSSGRTMNPGPTKVRVPRRRPPRNAVVAINSSDQDILKMARERVSLQADCGIEYSKIRKAANGGLLIEVLGAENSIKADKLAAKLKEVLPDQTVVTRPTIKGEVRLIGLDDSVTDLEIKSVIAQKGDCSTDDIKVGTTRVMTNGLGTVWLQCPLSAAIRATDSNKIRIGWTIARIELLQARPLQCYKCWKYGHTSNKCNGIVDRTRLCFRCGDPGHHARNCTEKPKCVLCSDAGFDCDHRIGSALCRVNGTGREVPKRDTRHREDVAGGAAPPTNLNVCAANTL